MKGTGVEDGAWRWRYVPLWENLKILRWHSILWGRPELLDV